MTVDLRKPRNLEYSFMQEPCIIYTLGSRVMRLEELVQATFFPSFKSLQEQTVDSACFFESLNIS